MLWNYVAYYALFDCWQYFRKLSPREKLLLAAEITKLTPDNLRNALEMLNENNPNFQYSADNVTTEDVTLDLDYQVCHVIINCY